MANMFSGKSNKQIPKNLEECTSPDLTATNLHHWSEKLENWGQILFIILIVIGIISTIIDTINMADINEDMAFVTCITSAITWGLYAFIEYCVYHVLALLISALASITQNIIVSANVALYEASQNLPERDSAQITNTADPVPSNKPTSTTPATTSENIWTCKCCGTNNNINYGQCKKCGKYRAQS